MTIETEEVCFIWEPRFVPLLLTRYSRQIGMSESRLHIGDLFESRSGSSTLLVGAFTCVCPVFSLHLVDGSGQLIVGVLHDAEYAPRAEGVHRRY